MPLDKKFVRSIVIQDDQMHNDVENTNTLRLHWVRTTSSDLRRPNHRVFVKTSILQLMLSSVGFGVVWNSTSPPAKPYTMLR